MADANLAQKPIMNNDGDSIASSNTITSAATSGTKRKKQSNTSDEENQSSSTQSRKNKNIKKRYREMRERCNILQEKYQKVCAAYAASCKSNKCMNMASSVATNEDIDDVDENEENNDTDDEMDEDQGQGSVDDGSNSEEEEDNVSLIMQQQQQVAAKLKQKRVVKVVSTEAKNNNTPITKKGNIVDSKEFATPNKVVNEPFIYINNNRGAKPKNKERNDINIGKKNIVKPPPISVYNQKATDLSSLLKANLNHSNFIFNIVNKNLIKVNLNNSYDHEIVTKALKAQNINFFSFTPKDKKLISVYVKGLPPDFTPDEVKQSIDDLGLNFTIFKIIKLKFNWIFQFHNGSDMEQIKSIKFLMNCRIHISDIKRTRVLQCRNCQRFNHTASNCSMKYRCVKCSEDHAPGACKVPSKENNTQKFTITNPATGEVVNRVGFPVFCVNCKKEGHVANSPTCEVRINLLKRMKEVRNKKSALHNVSPVSSGITNDYLLSSNDDPTPMSSFPSKVTFASLFSGNGASKNTKSTNAMSNLNLNMDACDIFSDCQKFFGMSFFQVLAKVKEFTVPYSKLKSEQDKALALLQFLIALNINV